MAMETEAQRARAGQRFHRRVIPVENRGQDGRHQPGNRHFVEIVEDLWRDETDEDGSECPSEGDGEVERREVAGIRAESC